MKRGGPQHPKTLDLAAELGLEPWGAVGLLESLWHFAAQYARRGDIGRHTDRALAAGVQWRGNPETLMAALVKAKCVDRCRCHRLRIHDWPDHADQAVSKTKEVESLGFLECYQQPESLISEGYPKDSENLPPAMAGPAKATAKAKEALVTNAAPMALTVQRGGWVGRVVDSWPGVVKAGHVGKVLSPVVKRYGSEAMLRGLGRWLEAGNAKFGVEVYARDAEAWISGGGSRASPTPKEQKHRAVIQASMTAGLKGDGTLEGDA